MSVPDAVPAELASTGALRAAINLGNPVLAQGTVDDPSGVTVALARELARRLDVESSLTCVDAARMSFDLLRAGTVDIAFLAIEPVREAEVAFTAPYVLIEGVHAVREDSPLTRAEEVDRPGIRIGVKEGSAYDLFLTRTVTEAELVRGRDGIDVFLEQGLDVAAGVRQPLARRVAEEPGLRLLEPRFMEIRQAVATRRDVGEAALRFLIATVEELKADGFVAGALRDSGQDAAVAPAIASAPG